MYEHGGNKKKCSPTLDDYNRLQHRQESGYVYREALSIPFYHIKEERHYNNTIESQYYKNKVTKDIFVVCCAIEGLVSKKEI